MGTILNNATSKYSKYHDFEKNKIESHNKCIAISNNGLFNNSSLGYIPNECKSLLIKIDNARAEIKSKKTVKGDVKSIAKKLGL
jgi:hypothetical protein